jgi:hypothetical protein
VSLLAAAYSTTTSRDDGSLLLGWIVLVVIVAACVIACAVVYRRSKQQLSDTESTAPGLPYFCLVHLPVAATGGYRAVATAHGALSAPAEPSNRNASETALS